MDNYLPWIWATYQLAVGYLTIIIVAAVRRDVEQQ